MMKCYEERRSIKKYEGLELEMMIVLFVVPCDLVMKYYDNDIHVP